MRVSWCVLFAAASIVLAGSPSAAQPSASAAAIYRVYLANGTALPIYGDAASTGDRVVFNLAIVRADGRLTLQLMTLPASQVDLVRTRRHAQAMRARVYAASRGEVDYASMLAAFAEQLSRLAVIDDRDGQLAEAQTLRLRLAAWPGDHFNYRAADVTRLVELLDAVIAGAALPPDVGRRPVPAPAGAGTPASGPASVSLDLTYDGAGESATGVSAADSVEAALSVAAIADVGAERIAVLRAAGAATTDPSLQRRVAAELERELEAELRYAALANEFRERAVTARRTGSVRRVEVLQAELPARDLALGRRRPQQVEILAAELAAVRDATAERRAALDRFRQNVRALVTYEHGVRPAFSGLDAIAPLLLGLRDLAAVPYQRLLGAEQRLQGWRDLVDAVVPPPDVVGAHATLVSALRMAQEACVRRRLADVTTRESTAREAASAAAGALLLGARARADLVGALSPPRD